MLKSYKYLLTKILFFLPVCIQTNSTTWIIPSGNLHFDEVHFLGAHNSLLSSARGWKYKQQHWELDELLKRGVRAFEVDLGASKNNEHLLICHGKCHGEMLSIAGVNIRKYESLKSGEYDTLQETFDKFAHWLHKHPNEVLIILFDAQRDPGIHANQIDEEIEKNKKFAELVITREYWDPFVKGEWPTLAQLRKDNKRIILFNNRSKFIPKNPNELITEDTIYDELIDSPKYTFNVRKYICEGGINISKENCLARSTGKNIPSEFKKMPRLTQFNHYTSISSEKILAYDQGVKATAKHTSKSIVNSKPIAEIKNFFKTDKKDARYPTSKVLKAIAPIKPYDPENYKHYAQKKKAVSDNSPYRIMSILYGCDKDPKSIYYHKKPNIILMDFVDKFIKREGLYMINCWNTKKPTSYLTPNEGVLREEIQNLINEVTIIKKRIDDSVNQKFNDKGDNTILSQKEQRYYDQCKKQCNEILDLKNALYILIAGSSN